MGRFQEKLEKEQLIMFRLVEIGTDLFAMAACLSRAEGLLAEDQDKESSQDLADLFCQNAEKRIDEAFTAIKHSNIRRFPPDTTIFYQNKIRNIKTPAIV